MAEATGYFGRRSSGCTAGSVLTHAFSCTGKRVELGWNAFLGSRMVAGRGLRPLGLTGRHGPDVADGLVDPYGFFHAALALIESDILVSCTSRSTRLISNTDNQESR